MNPDDRYAQVFLNLADNVTDKKLWVLAGGALAYSVIRFIEAYGLWRERTWAEWFALISGALYVPFEAYELVRRPTPIRAAVLAINLAVVFYMLYLRLSALAERSEEKTAESNAEVRTNRGKNRGGTAVGLSRSGAIDSRKGGGLKANPAGCRSFRAAGFFLGGEGLYFASNEQCRDQIKTIESVFRRKARVNRASETERM